MRARGYRALVQDYRGPLDAADSPEPHNITDLPKLPQLARAHGGCFVHGGGDTLVDTEQLIRGVQSIEQVIDGSRLGGSLDL